MATSQKSGSKLDDIRAKEQEYWRINAELEKKTANLMQEADDILVNTFSQPLKSIKHTIIARTGENPELFSSSITR
eukprot:m.204255 g.204255  ORF g.204255 m.204255 type:complete len:76 (+) comp39643_c0_seq34:316-543(+)